MFLYMWTLRDCVYNMRKISYTWIIHQRSGSKNYKVINSFGINPHNIKEAELEIAR